MLKKFFRYVWGDVQPVINPNRPLHPADLNQAVGFLLQQCRKADPERKARCKRALAHMNAARALHDLGYDPAIVNYVASQGLAAARA